ncbi:MAG: murein transglycosylase A [Shimia sp.]
MRGRAAILAAGLAGAVHAAPNVSLLEYEALPGWGADAHSDAMAVFTSTCGDMRDAEWKKLCSIAKADPDPRTFFEAFFKPVLIEDGKEMTFTGYFEPELRGSLTKSETYRWPLYRLPEEAAEGRWLTRREIEETGALDDRELEIAYIDDPVDVLFLQIQGSGRVKLDTGGVIRVGFGGSNRREYKSIGNELVRRGLFEPHEVSAARIKSYVKENPEEGEELLRHNDSYVFFREVNEVPAERGPLGAMNRSITTLRSIAVDPRYTPLGAPVWIEKEGRTPMSRLMVAQDTGSAIKGAQRADIFFGTGAEAGLAAGRIKDGGRMVVLMPLHLAYQMVPEEEQ